jgi:hypothetical protein
MRTMGDNEAPAGSAFPIFPMVGVLGLGVVAARAQDEGHLKVALRALHDHADDGRREVRDAVVAALGLALKAQPLRTLEGLEGWSDGYFHAELMLQALSDPGMTQHLQDVRLPLVRVQEAFALAAGAPRAHQRTHGYRALLRTMSGAIATLGTRFPHPVAQWVEEHAQVATKDLLAVLNTSLDQLSSGGLRRGLEIPDGMSGPRVDGERRRAERAAKGEPLAPGSRPLPVLDDAVGWRYRSSVSLAPWSPRAAKQASFFPRHCRSPAGWRLVRVRHGVHERQRLQVHPEHRVVQSGR